MPDKDKLIEPTKEAREAAAAVLGGAAPDGLTEGKCDTLSLVQAFARFQQEQIERDARIAEAKMKQHLGEVAAIALQDAATAIRQQGDTHTERDGGGR